MTFWDSIDYKKARKVLVIPNITNSGKKNMVSSIGISYYHRQLRS